MGGAPAIGPIRAAHHLAATASGVFHMATRLSPTLFRALCATTAMSVLALAAPAVMAQEVTGTIRGEVTDDDGNPIPGAVVTIVHTPSGTRSVVRTDASGGFSVANLRIGGPFDVSVEAPGFEGATATITNISAGEPQRISVFLVPEGQVIEVVAARTARSSIALASGPATILTAREIEGVASINRDIRSLVARDPFSFVDPTNGTGAIQIAGQNNRFNRITVDGIGFGDPFGLEAGGLASSRGPIPLDAIGEFTVEVAPVDIQQGQFQGGAVNTVLKSGSNNWGFTGFYSYSSDDLSGNRVRDRRVEQDFQSKIFGAQAGGPIIKDRLFFIVTYEQTDNSTPALVGVPGEGFANEIPIISRQQVDRIRNISNQVYNYDPLDLARDVPEKDKKIAVKVDWNIAEDHRAAFTFVWSDNSILAGQTGLAQVTANSPILSLQSNNYLQGSINYYGVFQLNSDWTNSFSTQLRVTYNDYERLQVPYAGREFGQFVVCLRETATTGSAPCPNGTGRVALGPDISRQANELFSETLGIEAQARLRQNNHDVKLIMERRQADFNNLFAQRVSGDWRFDSIADFEAGRANVLDLNVPIDPSGIDSVRAIFSNTTWTLGVQDTWDVLPSLTVTYGVRYDLFESADRPLFNQTFLNRYGFPNTANLNGRDLLQPRVALNWRPTPRLNARLTAGLFGGGGPNVWISNNYSNPGPTQSRAAITRTGPDTFSLPAPVVAAAGLTPAQVNALGAAVLNNVRGGAFIPQEFVTVLRLAGPALATTNSLDPDFRISSQWRVAGVLEWTADLGPLGDDWRFRGSAIWSRVRDNLIWTDLRVAPNAVQGTLPDGRPRYQPLVSATDTNTDIFLTNGDRGYSWNLAASVRKRWDNGLDFGMAYTWQRAKDENPGTSSVAFSNYVNTAVLDPNRAAYGTSIYQRDNAFRLNLGYERAFFGDNLTRLDLFFNSTAGQRFSYTMVDSVATVNQGVFSVAGRPGNIRSITFGTTMTNDRHLLYVPNVASIAADPIVTWRSEADFNAFRDFVLNSPLAKYQGQIAPKNIGRSPRFEKMDLRLSQEIPFVLGGKIQFFADFENFLNLLNKDWNALRQVPFPYVAGVVSVFCPQDAANPNSPSITSANQVCRQYRYTNVRTPSETLFTNLSLWQVRLGARLSF